MLKRDKKFFKAFVSLLVLAIVFLVAFVIMWTKDAIYDPSKLAKFDDKKRQFITGSQEDIRDLEEIDADGILNNYMLSAPYLAPNTAFYDEFGHDYQLSDYKDNFVILYFWASWCVSCNQELMKLQHLNGELELHKIHDLEILPISIDQKSVYELNSFYKSIGVDTLHIFHDLEHTLAHQFQVRSLPTTLLINKEGLVIARIDDHLDWNNEQISHEVMTLKGEDKSFEKGQQLLNKKAKHQQIKESGDNSSTNDIINSLAKKTKIIK